jgi:hypothetical protein
MFLRLKFHEVNWCRYRGDAKRTLETLYHHELRVFPVIRTLPLARARETDQLPRDDEILLFTTQLCGG